jgi:uncharacterized protein (TIGR03437 family)
MRSGVAGEHALRGGPFNTVDGTANTAAKPVKIGGSISLYMTGEGQTTPARRGWQAGGIDAIRSFR